MSIQIARARDFAALHRAGNPIVLANVWDAGSARILQASGARAIATTSAGVAWSLGYPDGNRVPRGEVLEALARIAKAVEIPLTADIENGYGATPDAVSETIRGCVEVGVVGVNIEDSLRPVDEQLLRLETARSAAEATGVSVFINSRIDTHVLGNIGGSEWLDETVRRAVAYSEVVANGVFVLGALRAESIQALTSAISLPVNVAFGPGTLSLDELAAAGASRISAGSSIAEAAYSVVQDWALALRNETNANPFTTPSLSWAALNRLAN